VVEGVRLIYLFPGEIPRQNPHYSVSRNLTNEGQASKTGHVRGRALVGGER
jgi:hypothetical protein